jgi:hypothetical protein
MCDGKRLLLSELDCFSYCNNATISCVANCIHLNNNSENQDPDCSKKCDEKEKECQERCERLNKQERDLIKQLNKKREEKGS